MNSSPKRILIVENDIAIAELLEEVLYEQNYSCLNLPHAKEILPVVYDFQPDIVLLDYLLPLATGQELCAEIKQNKSTSSLPVIIYSAFPEALLPLEEFQCDNFIAKPFDLFYLLQRIEQLASAYRHYCARTELGIFHC